MTLLAAPAIRRLHLGCGRDIRSGWINLDRTRAPGVDVAADLDACARTPLPFAEGAFDEFEASHVLEHLAHPLPFMQELHRIAAPGARAVFTVPHGAHDDAFTDPTHVRQYFATSFGYFGQPHYWRADYGYRGDWQVEYVLVTVDAQRVAGLDDAAALQLVDRERNVARELTAVLTAVKPAREPRRELQQQPVIEVRRVG
jgi:SAM-dependent methyltransferase